MTLHPKIREYDIVIRPNVASLCKAIQEGINVGWQPFGSVFYSSTDWNQPMVKYETDSDVNITPSGSIKIFNMTDMNGEIEALKEENDILKKIIQDCIASHEQIASDATYFLLVEKMYKFDSFDLQKEWIKLTNEILEDYKKDKNENTN